MFGDSEVDSSAAEPASEPEETSDDRRAAIERAAIVEFACRGFASTSMANIADAAGMSRPALYQYFKNKGDIFASAMTAVLEGAVDSSLAALTQPGTVADQLDGFLQRFDGDLWEATNASPLGEELTSAKTDYAPKAFSDAANRLEEGLRRYLADLGAADSDRTDEWAEMLRLSPKGFKYDEPSIAAFRRRLTALARSIAADIEAR